SVVEKSQKEKKFKEKDIEVVKEDFLMNKEELCVEGEYHRLSNRSIINCKGGSGPIEELINYLLVVNPQLFFLEYSPCPVFHLTSIGVEHLKHSTDRGLLDCFVDFNLDFVVRKGIMSPIKQERDDYQAQINSHQCPPVDHRELAAKNQKIAELEAEIRELKNKPPVQPENNPFTEKESLLTIIREKEKIIQQLEVKLQEQPKEIIKEVESGEIIQGLKNKLISKEQTIKQLHLFYLLWLGISVL
ncbi:543_t:CDS:2, partial [Ambispora leptoticha]